MKTFPEIVLNDLVLKRISEGDMIPMIEIAGFKIKNPTSADALSYINKVNQDFDTGNGITWGLCIENELIGTVGYYRGFENKTGEIGYVMREAYKRQGFMTRSIIAALDYGFDQLQLNKVTAFTESSNLASVNLLLKLGFENTQKEFEKYTIYSLSKDQFEKRPH